MICIGVRPCLIWLAGDYCLATVLLMLYLRQRITGALFSETRIPRLMSSATGTMVCSCFLLLTFADRIPEKGAERLCVTPFATCGLEACPKGPSAQIVGFESPKTFQSKDVGDLKPYYLGTWTL